MSPLELDSSALPEGPADLFALAPSVTDADGVPDTRVLKLRSVDERGWAIAGTASSAMGYQLAVHPAAPGPAGARPWTCVRGPVEEGSNEENLADLDARSQSARDRVDAEQWRLRFMRPTSVEFWQNTHDRNHHRIIYTRTSGGPGGRSTSPRRCPRAVSQFGHD